MRKIIRHSTHSARAETISLRKEIVITKMKRCCIYLLKSEEELNILV